MGGLIRASLEGGGCDGEGIWITKGTKGRERHERGAKRGAFSWGSWGFAGFVIQSD